MMSWLDTLDTAVDDGYGPEIEPPSAAEFLRNLDLMEG